MITTLRSTGLLFLSLVLVPFALAQEGATIKKKDGNSINGHVQGTVLLKQTTKAGDKNYGAIYFKVPGKDVLSIDEKGVQWKNDSKVEQLMISQETLPSDTEWLTAASDIDSTVGHRKMAEYTVKNRASLRVNGPGGIMPNPNPCPLAGELRYSDGKAEIIPALTVETAQGKVTVPVAEIMAPPPPLGAEVPKSKPMQGNLPTATPESIAWGKQILSSVKQTMGGSAIEKFTDQKATGNISFLTSTYLGLPPFKIDTTFKLPNKVLYVLILGTQESKFGFDGNTSWEVKPPTGTSKVLPDSDKKKNLAILGTNILMILRNYNSEGYTVQGLEKSELEGKAVDVVALTDKSSQETMILFVDMDTRLPLKVISGVKEELLSDYREVDGIKVAYKTTIMFDGVKSEEISLSEVKFNTGVSDSLFAKP